MSHSSSGCLGGFAFIWGDKVNRQKGSRKNWHAFFAVNGYTCGIVDELQNGWTSGYPINRAPTINWKQKKDDFNGKEAFDEIKLSLGDTYTALVDVYDVNSDYLRY